MTHKRSCCCYFNSYNEDDDEHKKKIRERGRIYYERNKEKILQKLKEKKLMKKENESI